MANDFKYTDERFADLQMLRYRLNGFDKLTARQKAYIYYLSEATLAGRDITTDQFGAYNLRIRKALEAVYLNYKGSRKDNNFIELEVYLKRLWFSNGIYHHYGCDKFVPGFTRDFLLEELGKLGLQADFIDVMYNPDLLPKKVNKVDGADLIETSACNFYAGVTQAEVEQYYNDKKKNDTGEPLSHGLNSKLVKENGKITEKRYTETGLYGKAIGKIVYWLGKAKTVAENKQQQKVIDLLIQYYKSGNLYTFNRYCVEWLKEQQGQVDFINGFIEVYNDPLGFKASWEGIVEYLDDEATARTKVICDNAQWFEDHSPVDSRFRKLQVKGVTAKGVCTAMLGGDEYPATAIGINLPNADWIRARYGSKSVTISNLTDAYRRAAHGNGFNEEFVIDNETRAMIDTYGDLCDDLHTDLHECLGHGSGQLLTDVNPDALKAYGNTIEEARADLFGLYYIADKKLIELGLIPDEQAYKAGYYTYMMNGLITQTARIEPNCDIEEAHMRNRALIAHWVYEHGNGAVSLVKRDDKTFVHISDYIALRGLFATLLAEIQRIKSEGDYDAARLLVETYGIKIDKALHEEVRTRYKRLGLAPYKGFINPRITPVYNGDEIIDVQLDYTETYTHQMLRYGKEYGLL